MKLYRFSPIRNKKQLLKSIEFIHFASHQLCKQSFGQYFEIAGNVGVFCHYPDEYEFLSKFGKELTLAINSYNQKYFLLKKPIVIPAKKGIPKTTYSHLYIRKPDPYRHHVGDVDFFVESTNYEKIKNLAAHGEIPGARTFNRTELDMVELFDPDIDVLAYVSTKKMTELVRFIQPVPVTEPVWGG